MHLVHSIKGKLLGTFAFLCLTAGVVGYVGVRGIGSLASGLHQVSSNLVPSLVFLDQVNHGFADAVLGDREGFLAVVEKNPEKLRHWKSVRDQSVARLIQGTKAYDAIPKEANEAAAWREYLQHLERIHGTQEKMWAHLEAGEIDEAQRVGATASRDIEETKKILAGLVESKARSADRRRLEGEATASGAIGSLFFAIGIALVVSMALGGYLTLAIARPLGAITDAATRLSRGELHQTIDHHGRDELGRLADAFRGLVGYVHGVAEAAEAASRGDLTYEVTVRSEQDTLSKNFAKLHGTLCALLEETGTLISAAQNGSLETRADVTAFSGGFRELLTGTNNMLDAISAPVREASSVLDDIAARNMTVRVRGDYQGEFGRIKVSLNTAADNLHDGLAQVAVATDQMGHAVSQIASGSHAVAAGASEQASSLEETSASLEEMSTMTGQNAANAAQANRLAIAARSASETGTKAMTEMTAAMRKVRASAEGTAAIISDINEIAFQTNLLALNAAVESARAGEAGRGFAVVAQEVRNLALRSKEAAKKTEALIKESVGLAQEGEVICKHVNENLDQIVASVGQVTTVVAEIAHASEEQARGIAQVNRAVAEMDKVTQANAATAEESASAAEELSGQANEVLSLVQRFRLNDDGTTARVTSLRKALPTARRGVKRPSNGTKANGHANGATIPFEDDLGLSTF
jgi:methyl-accepting chemotaxis protein